MHGQMGDTMPNFRSRRRRGVAPLEAVISAGLVFPFAVVMFWLGVKICAVFHHVVGTLVGWPYL